MEVTTTIRSASVVLAVLLTAPGSIAQDKAKPPRATEPTRITRVDFVARYKIADSTADAKPGAVIAVLQTNRNGDNNDLLVSLDDYTVHFMDSGSNANAMPAIAVGNQAKLMDGQMLQMWHSSVGQPLITGTVGPSQYISGQTILALLPTYVETFSLTIKHLNFDSGPLEGPGKGKPVR